MGVQAVRESTFYKLEKAVKVDQLKANQSELKTRYAESPETAIQTLEASGSIDFDNLAFNIASPNFDAPAGLHPASGGDGTFACPVEIMLAGWVSCLGVTCAAVAHSMHLDIQQCELTASGKMDFKGTLAVDKNSPVGLTHVKMEFTIQSNEEEAKLRKLVELTERYCVVQQTFTNLPVCETEIIRS